LNADSDSSGDRRAVGSWFQVLGPYAAKLHWPVSVQVPGARRAPETARVIKTEQGGQGESIEFCHLRPEGPIAGGAVLGEGQIAPSPPESEFGGALSTVQGGALATQRL